MAYHFGESYALVGKETTWGTSVTPTKDVGLVQNISPNPTKNVKKIYGLGTTEVQKLIQGKFEYSGSIDVAFQHGRLLEYIFGSVTHDATNSPDIKHTFAKAETLPSFTLEDGYNSTTDTVLTFSGVRLSSVKISVPSIDDDVRISADWLAKSLTTSTTASTPVISTLEVLNGSQATLTIDGTTIEEVQNCEFTINRGTDAIYGLGDQDPQAIEPKDFSIDFTATIGFKSKAELDRLLSSTGFTVELDISNGVTIGSGRRQLYLKLTNCVYTNVSKTTSVGEYVFVDISGHGIFDSCYTYDNITESNW